VEPYNYSEYTSISSSTLDPREGGLTIHARGVVEAGVDIPTLDEHRTDWSVVSVLGPDVYRDRPDGFDDTNPLHVSYTFNDVLETVDVKHGENVRPPTREDVEDLIERSDDLLQSDGIYVHCNAGVSRSTAISATLWSIHLGEGSEKEALRRVYDDRPCARPNTLYLSMADDILERDGNLVDAVDNIQIRNND
jgi:predicted protein tyrosine phosphatase